MLRVAHVTRAEYQWVQHVTVAKMTGVTDQVIEKIACDGAVTTLDEEGNLLCRVADEISLDVRLSDAPLGQIIERYGNRGAMELVARLPTPDQPQSHPQAQMVTYERRT